ncbi:MAG: RDD family protein [Betaproteobacteria bacterium]
MTRQTPLELTAADARAPVATLPQRLAAVGYEGLLLAAIVLLVGFLTLPLVSPAQRSAHAIDVPSLPARALSGCAIFAAAGLYFVWSWTGGRRTLPMKTWKLALERVDGRPVDAKTAVTRYLAAWIGPLASLAAFEALKPVSLGTHALWFASINYAWALVDPDRQFLHDRIAGTRIVRR